MPVSHREVRLAAQRAQKKGRADQLADRVALHEFRHVKSDHGFFAAEEVSRQ